jgi:hypothetical protein
MIVGLVDRRIAIGWAAVTLADEIEARKKEFATRTWNAVAEGQ